MKKLLFICLLVSFVLTPGKSHNLQDALVNSNPDSLQIVTTQNLSAFLASSIDGFKASGSGNGIDVEIIGNENAFNLMEPGQLGLKSDLAKGITNPDLWTVTVGREIMVSVTSKSNPYLSQLKECGIKPSAYSSLLRSGNKSWASVTGSEIKSDLAIFCTDIDFARQHLSALCDLETSEIILGDKNITRDIAADLRSNSKAIGFCRLTDILNEESNAFQSDIELIAIDINENGLIDHFENYTGSYAELLRAVWIGKYPKSLFNEIRLLAAEKPGDKATLAFVEWMFTNAQENMYTAQLTELQFNERRSSLNKLLIAEATTSGANSYVLGISRGIYWIVGISLTIFLFVIIMMFTYRRTDSQLDLIDSGKTIDEDDLLAPAGVLFDRSHTWSYMEKNGLVKVGLADFMQHVTGRISRIEFKKVGETVKRGQPLFTLVQDGKQLVIKSPISGNVESINNELINNSEAINSSPYAEGWIYEVKPDNWMAEYSNFLIGETYTKWLTKEIVRLKEFLSSTVLNTQTSKLQVVMQDGGEIMDNLMEAMGPELWEEFQVAYIDKAR